MILVADVHLKEETEDTVFGQVFPGLKKAAMEDPDRTLACLGDFWHVRYRVSVRLQNRVVAYLENLVKEDVEVIFLPGNHDQINVTGENALEIFSRIASVSVYSIPTVDRFGYWLPYRKRGEEIAKSLKDQLAAASTTRVLFTHMGIQGAYMNNHIQDKDGLPAENFGGWTVLSGHYHRRQEIGPVRYIGSPYQVKGDEMGQDKGYAFWDTETRKLYYRTMDWGKRYHRLELQDGKLDLSGVRPGDEVRAIAPPNTDLARIAQELEKAGVRGVVTPEVETKTSRLDVGAGASLGQYVEEYVKEFGGDLDSAKLMDIFAELGE